MKVNCVYIKDGERHSETFYFAEKFSKSDDMFMLRFSNEDYYFPADSIISIDIEDDPETLIF